MPVLPLVGSTITVLPGVIVPARSAASIIASPIRSLTLLAGLKYSSLAAIVACVSFTRPKRTSGVLPTSSVMLL